MPDQMRSYLDFEKPVAELDSKLDELRTLAASGSDITDEIGRIEDKAAQALADLYLNLTPWQKTLVARHPQRPHFNDFIKGLITEFTPLAGDRKFRRGRGAGRRLRPLPRRGHLRDGPGKGRFHREPHQA
ncbi:acetyl-CoA carboxylase alpha subunit [Bradyrhizobium sp. LM3.6]